VRRGQDREFERTRADTVHPAQLDHERGDLVIRQRRMMLDTANLATTRQQVFEMAAPARRVFASAITARRRPIDDRFDAAAHPAGGFGLRGPDRLQRSHDEPDVDALHRQ
jgi:hypothetical protein